MKKNLRAQMGFSLLEILVAVGILSVALVSIIAMQGSAMRASLRAENLSLATMLAKKQMAEYEVQVQQMLEKGEFPDDKTEEGSFSEPYSDFHWRTELRSVELPAPPSDEGIQGMIAKQLTGEISKSVRQMTLTVFWPEGETEQEISVVTHVVKM